MMSTNKLLLFLLHLALLSNTKPESCTDSDTCVENDKINYIEHILSLPRNYNCENIRDSIECRQLKDEGICEIDPGYMSLECSKTCGFCHLKDQKIRCQRHPDAKQAVKPGDINKMFERLLTDFPQYEPQVLSRDPWLVVLNNVLTDEECTALIEIGGRNFHRSKDAGQMSQDGQAKFEEIVSEVRTSFTDWCVDDCWEIPIINGIAQKAENITLIPKENSEYFQVLRYEIGQYYRQHHDYIAGHLDLPIGPRVYTFFLYLNDVEKGGGTGFPDLDIIVQPKKGSVAIWPSVLSDNPFKRDERTGHEAFPVEEGVKYGANMWLHMYNFHGPFSLTCTG
eukprot:232804_1